MKCTVCTHPQHQAIDQALLAGDATYEALSRQYGPSPSAIYRHKKHLEAKTRRARQRLRDNLSLGFFCKLNNFLAQIQNAAQTADAEGNAAVVLKAATVGTRIITSLAKQELPLELDMVYRFLASPQWATQEPPAHRPAALHRQPPGHRRQPVLPLPRAYSPLPAAEAEADGDADNDWNEMTTGMKAGQADEISQLLPRLDLGPSPASPSLLATRIRNSKLPQPPTGNWPPKTNAN